VLRDPLTIVCGSTAAVCRADAVDGGWRVSGRWPWASGCHNAHWFGGQVHAYRDGEQITSRPVYAFAPRGDFEILDTWYTAGMRGSGSHDVVIDDLVVPDEQIAFYDKAWVAQQRAESTLARIPLGVRLGHNKAAVALGIARAAIDAFVDLAAGKTPAFGTTRLCDRPYAHQALARAEARLRAGRAWVLEVCDEAWDTAEAHRPFTDRQKALFLMACSDTTAGCVESVEAVVEAAGTTANITGHPLDRHRRDVTVVRSHVTVAPHLRVEAGARLLGLDTPSFLFDLP
jgi:alkylation response protein AidB-like acyl-CoA dehydrogenase